MQSDESVVKQLHVFFEPKSVAVVGASRKIDKAGHVIFKNFVANKRRGIFKGGLYPLNPKEDYILDYKCYPSITKIPEPVELIVIVVPAAAVPNIMNEAAAKGVKAAVIVTAGFSEIGNHELENKVKAIAKKAGIRVLGPNCLGVYDSYTGVDMLFLPETKVLTSGDEMVATPRPMAGRISIVTQSGAFGASALDYLTGRQIGISKFVSFGNKMDVNESETLQYLMEDKNTRAILLYVEGINSGREFMKVAARVTKKKPIVALKSGRTAAGSRAAISHTGAMTGSDRIYDTVFAQVGIIRARDMEEFFDLSKALAFQPPAKGSNVGILTDAGGPGVMAADECELLGLFVKRFSEKTNQKFEELKKKGMLAEIATYGNPVDLTGLATSETFEHATQIILEDPDIHGLIVLGLHHLPGLQEDFVDRVAKIAGNYIKPVVACDIGETEMALYVRYRFDKLGIPSYSSPEDAARSMNALVAYGAYLQKTGQFENYMKNFLEERE